MITITVPGYSTVTGTPRAVLRLMVEAGVIDKAVAADVDSADDARAESLLQTLMGPQNNQIGQPIAEGLSKEVSA